MWEDGRRAIAKIYVIHIFPLFFWQTPVPSGREKKIGKISLHLFIPMFNLRKEVNPHLEIRKKISDFFCFFINKNNCFGSLSIFCHLISRSAMARSIFCFHISLCEEKNRTTNSQFSIPIQTDLLSNGMKKCPPRGLGFDPYPCQ